MILHDNNIIWSITIGCVLFCFAMLYFVSKMLSLRILHNIHNVCTITYKYHGGAMYRYANCHVMLFGSVVTSRINTPVVKQLASLVTSRLSHKSSRCSVVIFNCGATFRHNAFGAQLWHVITAEQPRCRLLAVRPSRLDVHHIGPSHPGFCLEYYSWHWSISGLLFRKVSLLSLLIIVWLLHISFVGFVKAKCMTILI